MPYLMHQPSHQILAQHVILATSLYARMKGLMGKKDLPASTALWLRPCQSIHTCFMHFSIDVIFVTRSLIISHIVRNITPWRLLVSPPLFSRSHSTFEFKTPLIHPFLQKGDQLYVGD